VTVVDEAHKAAECARLIATLTAKGAKYSAKKELRVIHALAEQIIDTCEGKAT
jgi:hypothetical protein